jgi:uncharacterized BrkB/YihY/UPF0761 family membrane protein
VAVLVVAFLVWMWITNIAVLLGAELDAELQRSRAIAAGHDPPKSRSSSCATTERSRRAASEA